MKKILSLTLIIFVFIGGCSVYKTLVNISKLQFKLTSVNSYKVSGINISSKRSLSDFNAADIINLTSSITQGKFPVSFTLNVEAKNPNDGSGMTRAADISIKSFAWKLLLNDKETISGNILEPIVVPGKGESTIIPFEMSLDLIKFFGNRGLENIINLALNVGGAQGSTSHIKLIAEPVLGTPLGEMKYPEPLTIVDTKFN